MITTELVIVHLPDNQNVKRIIPIPAVVLQPGEQFSLIRIRLEGFYKDIEVANELLTSR